jgi:ribosome-binding factor A
VSPQPSRSVRVAELVRKHLAAMVSRELSDPRLQHVIVSRVEVTDDLQLARVFVRLAVGDSTVARVRVLRALRSAAGLVRRRLGEALELRRTPELRFAIDEGVDAQQRIDELLGEIESERKGGSE